MSETTPQDQVQYMIGLVSRLLLGLTPFSNQIILDSFRLACKGRTIKALDGHAIEHSYVIVDVLWNVDMPGAINARLQEVHPD
jgi:hypothetical protein